MLNMIEFVSARGANLLLPFEAISEGLFVKDIEGLDPVKANIVSSSFAQLDGAQYHTSRREARNIVLKLGLELGYTPVKEIRKRLYEFFMPKSEVTLRFHMDDMPMVEIKGRVESFVSPLFVKEPEITISLLCFDPDFYTPERITIPWFTTDTEDEILVEYEGTVETGLLFIVEPNREMLNFTINHRSADDTASSLEFVVPLSGGDRLEVSTVSGAKGATLTRFAVDSSVLYGITPQSNWINLFPGTNYIRVYSGGNPVPYTIEYANKFGGL